jgi:dTDP-4-amino-4,6-dideoxygalactose transaminase
MLKLAKPDISEAAIAQIADVIRTGNLIQGRNVRDFETALEKYFCVKHAVACSSGTAALHLSLLVMSINTDDEIISPAFTFPATANVVIRSGGKVVLADISPDDLCLDPRELEKVITNRTKAIIIVHEFGQSAQIDEITALADKQGIKINQDAASPIGTAYYGQKVGTFGLVGCFSFHPRKVITTGEGGAVITNNDKIAERLRMYRNHGIEIKDGSQEFVEAGLNYRMTEIQAVLGLHQLPELENIIKKRFYQAQYYNNIFANTSCIQLPRVIPSRSSIYQTYHIIVANHINRNKLIETLRSAGIEAGIGAQALNCTTYYQQKYGYRPEDFPNATRAHRQGIALPIGHHLGDNDIQHIAETLLKALEHYEN